MAKGKAAKKRVKENRYSKAVGELLFTFEADVATGSQAGSCKEARHLETYNRTRA